MFRFLDGPAAGAILNLQRAPLFLRVVIADDGTVDALDKVDDVPRPDETIHVYLLDKSSVSSGFVCSRGKRRGCERFLSAEYSLFHDQPTDNDARNNAAWSEWAILQANELPK